MQLEKRKDTVGQGVFARPVEKSRITSMDSEQTSLHEPRRLRGCLEPMITRGDMQPTPVSKSNLRCAVVQEVMQLCELLQLQSSSRILLLEHFLDGLGTQIRCAGFTGEITTLVSHPLPVSGVQKDAAYARVFVGDWPSATDGWPEESLAELGHFDVIVAVELVRVLPREALTKALGWAATLLVPQGYLISAEPASSQPLERLELDLLPSGLLLAADERLTVADWDWALTRWQLRPGDSSRLTGHLTQVTAVDLDQHPSLRFGLISSYREVFGGDEWSEWMSCSECQRHYSRREYEELASPDQCICGAVGTLVPFHTPQYVLAQLHRDLPSPDTSRLYVRKGPHETIEAFIWGTLCTAGEIVQELLPRQSADERQRLLRTLSQQLEQFGVTDPSALIYHQAFIGALEPVRVGVSLVRSLFTRMCQFALDHSVEYVVTATIPSVSAYSLLRGIGMYEVYTYRSLSEGENSQNVDVSRDERARIVMPPSRLDESGVILGGSVRELLAEMSSQSDRQLVAHIVRYMKQQQARVSQ